MSITIKNRTVVLALLGVLTAIFLLGGYLGIRKERSRLTASIRALEQQISRQEITIGENKVYITSIEQENIDLKRAVKQGLVEKEALKKLHLKTVNELTKANIRIEVLKDSVKHNGTIITVHDTVYRERNAILLPFSFGDSTKFYSFTGQFNDDGRLSMGFEAPAKFNIYTSYIKKDKEYRATITTDNPYVKIEGIESFKFDAPKDKKWGLGFQGGYGVTKDGLSPYVGIGIQRTILRF